MQGDLNVLENASINSCLDANILHLTATSLLAVPEDGTLEYDGHRFYITNHDTQRAIDRTSDVALSTVTVKILGVIDTLPS